MILNNWELFISNEFIDICMRDTLYMMALNRPNTEKVLENWASEARLFPLYIPFVIGKYDGEQ